MPVHASRVQGPELFRHTQGYDRITVGKSLGLYRQCSDASVLDCED